MADNKFEPEISRSLKKFAIDGIVPKTSLAFECKREAGTSFRFDRLEEHQLEALVDFERSPFTQKMLVSASVGGQSRFQRETGFDFLYVPLGTSYVLINFRSTKKAAGKDIPKGTNRCFALRIHEYIIGQALLETYGGRKSFPYKWIEQNALEINRIKWEDDKGKTIYGWDLMPLLVDQTNKG